MSSIQCLCRRHEGDKEVISLRLLTASILIVSSGAAHRAIDSSSDCNRIQFTCSNFFPSMDSSSSGDRLCELYLRDVISFLSRKEIAYDCRPVSRHIDSTVGQVPLARLPRHFFGLARLRRLSETIGEDQSNLLPIVLPEDCCFELRVGICFHTAAIWLTDFIVLGTGHQPRGPAGRPGFPRRDGAEVRT